MNRGSRICSPMPYHLAMAPSSEWACSTSQPNSGFAVVRRLRIRAPILPPKIKTRFDFVEDGDSHSYINFCSFRNRKIGAGDEARTRYLHLGKVALYRMSYARINYVAGLPCHHRAETLDDEQVGDESPPDAIWWCLRSESNQRHADFQSAALPSELQRHIYLVGTTGLEPVTPCL